VDLPIACRDAGKQEFAGRYSGLKERYGFGTLKKLLIACETFEVYDEPLANGTFRTLYRVRRGN